MNTLPVPACLEQLGGLTRKPRFAFDNPAPHCTNPACPFFYHQDPADSSWRTDHGCYCTRAFGVVPRYRCRGCGRTFSQQSFKLDYYVKQPVDYIPLIKALVSTSGQGNISRFTALRYELIQNRFERLARFFLAVQARLRSALSVQEELVLDGFESFSRSQYFPNNINLIVGAATQFIYQIGFSQLRRKGAMSDHQKRRRQQLEVLLGKAPPKAVEDSVVRLVEDICKWLAGKGFAATPLRTDEQPAYVRALKRVAEAAQLLVHEQYCSRAPRTVGNRLFAVNYVDRQLRKDQVNHVRQTVQFARCPAAMMSRLTIYQGYHNYLMPRRVRSQREGDWSTRAEALGLGAGVIWAAIVKLWGKRIFYHHTDLWQEEQRTWLMGWRNKGVELGRRVPLYIRD
jgi:hypothetical protein